MSRWCRTRAAPSARSAADVDEMVLVVSVSETHNRANVRRTVAQSFAGFAEVFDVARGSGKAITGALATSFGCPFEGVIPEQQVMDGVARYVDLGVAGVTLADTTGMANPRQVEALVRRVRERWPDLELALHFHNTRGMGLANVLAGLSRRRRALRGLLSAAWAAARSRRARPETSAPKTWCTCCTAWAMRPASTWTCCSRHRGAWARSSGTICRARWSRRESRPTFIRRRASWPH